jgi:glycosyltransferase involved in cell wall biosynthesis
MKFSVVVPTYNRKTTLRQTLAALRALKYRASDQRRAIDV